MEHDLHTFNTISEANFKYLQFVERKGPWKLKCIFLCHLFSVIPFFLLTNCYTLSNCIPLSNKLLHFYIQFLFCFLTNCFTFRQWEESTRCFRWVATMVTLSKHNCQQSFSSVQTEENCQQKCQQWSVSQVIFTFSQMYFVFMNSRVSLSTPARSYLQKSSSYSASFTSWNELFLAALVNDWLTYWHK